MLSSTEEAALAGGILGGIFATVMICALFYYILTVIAGWKIFKKAGEKGWKALIPIYNSYIFFKIVGMKNWFWVLLCVAFLTGLVVGLTGFDTNNLQNNSYTGANLVGTIAYCASGIFAIIITIWHYCRLSKAFGHGIPFALGLIFLSFIFLLILGFGSSKYDKELVKSWS